MPQCRTYKAIRTSNVVAAGIASYAECHRPGWPIICSPLANQDEQMKPWSAMRIYAPNDDMVAFENVLVAGSPTRQPRLTHTI